MTVVTTDFRSADIPLLRVIRQRTSCTTDALSIVDGKVHSATAWTEGARRRVLLRSSVFGEDSCFEQVNFFPTFRTRDNFNEKIVQNGCISSGLCSGLEVTEKSRSKSPFQTPVCRENLSIAVLRKCGAAGEICHRVYVTPHGFTAEFDRFTNSNPTSHEGVEDDGILKGILLVKALPEILTIF